MIPLYVLIRPRAGDFVYDELGVAPARATSGFLSRHFRRVVPSSSMPMFANVLLRTQGKNQWPALGLTKRPGGVGASKGHARL
jgi:hypothetical protein